MTTEHKGGLGDPFHHLDLCSGAAYAAVGTSEDQFTPIFAVSRVAGWTAHVMERHTTNRLIPPRAESTGPTDLADVPLEER